MEKLIINSDTGEVLDELKVGDRILRAKCSQLYKEIEENFTKAPKEENFTKLYHKIIDALVEADLTAAELLMFMHLATNLRYGSNVAKYSNGRLITRESLSRDLKKSIITVKRGIITLIKAGLVVEVKTLEGKVFIVNPYVVMVGDKVNKTVFDLFRKSKWARW